MRKKKYLLDTCICVFLLRGKYNVDQSIDSVGWENCAISEITETELLCGVEYSSSPKENYEALQKFLSKITIIPFGFSKYLYAKERAFLRSRGQVVDDFDLLIGCTAVAGGMVMVTDNRKHFERIRNIEVENWIVR